MRNHSRSRKIDHSRKNGFKSGWLDGWRLGACQGIDAVDAGTRPAAQPQRNARILYVPQGFEAIDQGVIFALQNEVTELCVAPANEMQLQAAQFRPDAVLVMNGLHVFPPDHLEQIDAIRQMGIPTIIWFVDDPYVTDLTVQIAPHYDYIFTHERSCLTLYHSVGCAHVYHLPLAAHFDLFRPMSVPHEYKTDICFIGVAFWNRVELFDEIAPYLKDKRVLIGGILWDRMKNYSMVSRFVHDQWIEVPETAKYYNGAKIVINLHRTPETGKDNLNGINWPAESINPRTFEMAACGTLQLTDMRSELPEHYVIGSEIAVFNNAQELIHQMDYYLTHDAQRLQVAARGYQRTKRNHTFGDRIRTLLDVIGLR
jgi:spore maturation protein CgeB